MHQRDFSGSSERPYGRHFGKTLDPLDAREGFPENGVEIIGRFLDDDGPHSLDAKKELILAAKASAARAQKQGAVDAAKQQSAAKAKAAAGASSSPPSPSPSAPAASSSAIGPFTADGAKASLPYVAVAVVLVVVISHFVFRGGAA
jgi:hypothetical protein